MTDLSGMFKAEYLVYLCMYIMNISCICENNTANHLKIWSAVITINTLGKSLIFFLLIFFALDFCRFCVVIRFFNPCLTTLAV